MNVSRRRIAVIAAGALVGSLVLTLPASSVPRGKGKPLGPQLTSHVSQQVALRHWVANPDTAPAPVKDRIEAVRAASDGQRTLPTTSRGRNRFNLDGFGLPQNEESVSACR